jgi:two-component system OmpR family sensor kinase
MSFRAQNTLTIAALTALTLGGGFAGVSVAFNTSQEEQLDASLLAVALTEAAEVRGHGMRFTDRPGPPANDIGPLTKFGIIYGPDGSTKAATYPFEREPPALADIRHPFGEAFDYRFEHEHMRGVMVPVHGQADYVLFLATSRADFDDDKAYLAKAMGAAFLVAVAWATMVAYWMSGRLTRDHRNIAAVARNVARGNLKVRTDVRSRDPEVAQLALDVDEMVARLNELVTSQKRFIAHAAHELRSPLSAVYGELQLALRKERDSAGYRQAIEHALDATRRLKMLADDLLTIARPHEETEVDSDPVSLQGAVSEAGSLVVDLAQAKKVALELDIGKTFAVSDRHGDITRLFRNLLENAIRHSPEGGAVRVEAMREGSSLFTAVMDDGPGIDAKDRDRIFDPFFRSPNSRGVGLGLGIAREIARAHGGDLTLDPGGETVRGARFVVILPAL